MYLCKDVSHKRILKMIFHSFSQSVGQMLNENEIIRNALQCFFKHGDVHFTHMCWIPCCVDFDVLC